MFALNLGVVRVQRHMIPASHKAKAGCSFLRAALAGHGSCAHGARSGGVPFPVLAEHSTGGRLHRRHRRWHLGRTARWPRLSKPVELQLWEGGPPSP